MMRDGLVDDQLTHGVDVVSAPAHPTLPVTQPRAAQVRLGAESEGRSCPLLARDSYLAPFCSPDPGRLHPELSQAAEPERAPQGIRPEPNPDPTEPS